MPQPTDRKRENHMPHVRKHLNDEHTILHFIHRSGQCCEKSHSAHFAVHFFFLYLQCFLWNKPFRILQLVHIEVHQNTHYLCNLVLAVCKTDYFGCKRKWFAVASRKNETPLNWWQIGSDLQHLPGNNYVIFCDSKVWDLILHRIRWHMPISFFYMWHTIFGLQMRIARGLPSHCSVASYVWNRV